MDFLEFRKAAARVVPSEKQMKWYETGMYAFIHFGVNTFTGSEWGTGKEDPKIFNPEKLDCGQWVDAVKSAGLKGMVLTAKHHDGFCLWPSGYTEHTIKNSPYKNGKGDVVREAAEACRKGGIKFGVYLSPWDRNSKLYGTPKYNDFYCNQLTELCTRYGELFYLWFDGACGEGPNGKKQEYDFRRYKEIIRKYQPNACIFHSENSYSSDIRWVGNEAGKSPYEQWSVVPALPEGEAGTQTGPGPLACERPLNNTIFEKRGSLDTVIYSKGLVFWPAEADVSIRRGWFYHPEEEPHPLERLLQIYLNSYGNNAGLNLNIPPDKNGLFDQKDALRLKEFGEMIKEKFSQNKAAGLKTKKIRENENGQAEYELAFGKNTEFDYIVLKEDISKGQRVEAFRVGAHSTNGNGEYVYEGATIGYRKIIPLCTVSDKINIKIIAARDCVNLLDVEVY